MQKFTYTAKDDRGKAVKGEMMVSDEAELSTKISQMGYFLTGFKASKDASGPVKLTNMPNLKGKDVLYIAFQLSTLLDAGLPLLEGLKDLARESDDPRVQRVVDDIRYRVESGSSLKEALALHPQSFPKLFIAIIGAGESTGHLPEALADLNALLEWQMELMAKLKEAATYPIILFCVLVGVVTMLVVKVIPMFKPIFSQMDVALPLPTIIVMAISDIVRSYWYVVVITIVAIVAGFKAYASTGKGRYVVDGIKLKLPIFGELIRKITLSRFAHTFALSFKSGISLLTCLDIAKETCGNARIEHAVTKARDSVNVGEKLATSLQITGEFPPLVVRMVAVGEQSGSLTQTLNKVADYYDKEVAASIKRMFALFEPVMIVLMGGIVGTIALAIFMPIFKISQSIGGN